MYTEICNIKIKYGRKIIRIVIDAPEDNTHSQHEKIPFSVSVTSDIKCQ